MSAKKWNPDFDDMRELATAAASLAGQAKSDVSFAIAVMEHLLETLVDEGVLKGSALARMMNKIAFAVDQIAVENELQAEHKKKLEQMTKQLAENLGLTLNEPGEA